MKFRLLAVASIIGLVGAFATPGMSQVVAVSSGAAGAHGTAAVPVPGCRPEQLRIRNGPEVSEKTQQETRIFVARNLSSRSCRLDSYPVVSLFTARGRVLGFRYRDHGDQMLTSATPHLVVLVPGGRSYFGINKNVCVLRSTATAWYLAAFPPNRMIRLSSPLDHCSRREPTGHVVDISPFEKTVLAVLAG
jgi:Domain of unknown function (DUF4232)